MGPGNPTPSGASKSYVIPKLAWDGSNWISWKTQTLATLAVSRGVSRHIEGTAREPPPIPTFPSNRSLTVEEDERLEKAEKRWDEYYQREATVKAQIFTTVPESLLIELQKLKTAKDIWDAVCAKHEGKALTVKVDLRRHLYAMKCEDESQVRSHLETLMRTQEQLTGMAAGLADPDLVMVILGSLPKSYRPLINAITMSAAHAKAKLKPDNVVENLLDEFERLAIEDAQLKANENALTAAGKYGKSRTNKGNPNTSKSDHTDAECWNCGKKGHIRRNCHSKKKRNDGKDKDSANTATGGEEFAFTTTFAGAMLARDSNPPTAVETDVYDSGASTHMSPTRERFLSLKTMPSKPIKAADKVIFHATVMGDMRVPIPNGKKTSYVTLKDVLYCPDLAFTLVSLSRCDRAGYSALLKDQKCHIRDTCGTVVGQIPLSDGLYKVTHNPMHVETANATRKLVTIDELHRQMGHISPQAAKKIVKDGAVTGIDLDMDSKPSFCDACAKAKPTRQPVPKERNSPLATNVGEKIHFYVWGPATPKSYDGKDYFISFTDDHSRWSWVEPMSRKNEALSQYKSYEAWMETQYHTKIR